MYSTCIFCHAALGANAMIEHFPVGRRLTFDGEKGRLWAVCTRCGRWNLSPLTERWEALEECERAFRGTSVRSSTEHIGLARLADGTELVRIGAPLRPEFAAWRYGSVFAGRHRRMWLSSLSATAVAASLAGGVLGAGAAFGLLPLVGLPVAALAEWRKRGLPRGAGLLHTARARKTLVDNEGTLMEGGGRVMDRVRLMHRPAGPYAWGLEVHTVNTRMELGDVYIHPRPRTHLLSGPSALRAIAVLTAHANADGGTQAEVSDAVRLIDRNYTAERFLARAEELARKAGAGYRDVWALPPELRMALEMASNEDGERRAMEGEMAELERHWREAEAVASIADSLVVPAGVEEHLERLRRAVPPPEKVPRH